MGRSKTNIFDTRQNELAVYAKALGHPARIAILDFLMNGTCVCGDIVDEIGLAQSTISQHLKELKNAGLIKGIIEGPKTCYCINEEGWNNAQQAINSLFEAYKKEKMQTFC